MDGRVFANPSFGPYLYSAPLFVLGGLGCVVVVEALVYWAMGNGLALTDALLASAWANFVSTMAGAAIASRVNVSIPAGLAAGYALSVVIEALALWPFWKVPLTRLAVRVAAANLASYALLAVAFFSFRIPL